MPTSLADIAQLAQGKLLGDGRLEVSGASTLCHARPGEITFIDRADKLHLLARTQASSVVVPRDVAPAEMPALQVDDVHAAFARVVMHFRPRRVAVRIGVSPLAVVSPSAKLAEDVDVHPGATIAADVHIGRGVTVHTGAHVMAGCRIGEDTVIFPSAVLYEDTVVGPRCVIHAGAVLGAHGFGYRVVDGRHQSVAQLGYVELGADVEIGACTTIDRGTYGPTTIGEGTKIDNMVQIAHNCRIGRHNLLCAQVGVAGSTSTGDYVVMAGQVGVRDHVHVGDRAVLGAQAGVPNDVPPDVTVIGSPARPERELKLILAATSKLPEMRRQLRALERTVEQMQRDAGGGGTHAAA